MYSRERLPPRAGASITRARACLRVALGAPRCRLRASFVAFLPRNLSSPPRLLSATPLPLYSAPPMAPKLVKKLVPVGLARCAHRLAYGPSCVTAACTK